MARETAHRPATDWRPPTRAVCRVTRVPPRVEGRETETCHSAQIREAESATADARSADVRGCRRVPGVVRWVDSLYIKIVLLYVFYNDCHATHISVLIALVGVVEVSEAPCSPLILYGR